MEQTELLWLYQQADMAADAFESEIKRSPTRIALKKNREFLVEQQNAVKRMESTPPADLQQAQSLNRDAQKLLSDLDDYEQEMKRIQKDASDRDRQEKDIRVKYARVKAEYDQQKVAYEAEYKNQLKQLEQKRSEAQEKAKAIDPALLEKYAVIKKHCIPPVARLYGDQCGGCNMSLPQVTLRKFKSDVKYIECENCGRLIIQ